MSIIKNIHREYIYDKIEKNHDKYFVTYHPIDRKKQKNADLIITFTQLVDIKEIARIMEEELDKWITKYPLPIMVFAYDKKDDNIFIESIKESNNLVGYLTKESNEVVKTWNIETLPDGLLYDDNVDIDLVYKGLSYKKRGDIEKDIETRIKDKRRIKKFIDITLLLWLAISVTIAFLGWRSLLVGTIAFAYSVLQVIRRFLRLKGYKTKNEKDNQDKKRRMEHYYDHCERNPEGFRKLRAENFEEIEKERIKKERESINN